MQKNERDGVFFESFRWWGGVLLHGEGVKYKHSLVGCACVMRLSGVSMWG
jgi:hypothetical protein